MTEWSGKGMVGYAGIFGIGGGLLVCYLIILFYFRTPFATGILLPALLAASVVGAGYWFEKQDYDSERVYRLSVWCAAITVFAAALGIINIYSEWLIGNEAPSSVITIANSASFGAVLGVLIGMYDTERTQEHEQVKEKQAQIESLNERLTVLNRVLRHDIRNDVNLIQGYIRMAGDDHLSTQESHDLIERKAQEIAALSNRARQLETLLKKDRKNQTVDLVEIVTSEIADLREGHPDDVDIALRSPNSAVVIGNDLLQSVVDNLLENAVEHSESSLVKLDIEITDTGDGVNLSIADNGPGLPAHERRILTSGQESDLEHSSGTGLWLVNWIIPEFGGSIDLGREDSDGTKISIWLPKPDAKQSQTSPTEQSQGIVATD
jgi:two-component system OmpR family sensor kinase